MEYFLIYLIGISDSLKETLIFIGVVGSIGCLGVFCAYKAQALSRYTDKKEQGLYNKLSSKSFKGFVLSFSLVILSQLIPNSKTLIAMATIPPVIHNEQVQQLPENVLGFINDYLKEKRNELQGVSGSSGKV